MYVYLSITQFNWWSLPIVILNMKFLYDDIMYTAAKSSPKTHYWLFNVCTIPWILWNWYLHIIQIVWYLQSWETRLTDSDCGWAFITFPVPFVLPFPCSNYSLNQWQVETIFNSLQNQIYDNCINECYLISVTCYFCHFVILYLLMDRSCP